MQNCLNTFLGVAASCPQRAVFVPERTLGVLYASNSNPEGLATGPPSNFSADCCPRSRFGLNTLHSHLGEYKPLLVHYLFLLAYRLSQIPNRQRAWAEDGSAWRVMRVMSGLSERIHRVSAWVIVSSDHLSSLQMFALDRAVSLNAKILVNAHAMRAQKGEQCCNKPLTAYYVKNLCMHTQASTIEMLTALA